MKPKRKAKRKPNRVAADIRKGLRELKAAKLRFTTIQRRTTYDDKLHILANRLFLLEAAMRRAEESIDALESKQAALEAGPAQTSSVCERPPQIKPSQFIAYHSKLERR